MIEYLLQLDSGDYTKLKDVLEDNDGEIIEELLSEVISIKEAFKKLERRRKKETSEEKENKKIDKITGNEDTSGVEHIQETGEEGDQTDALTDEQIKGMTIHPSDLNNIDGDLNTMVNESNALAGYEPYKQNPYERERLDPKLRKAILVRDENECQICRMIKGMAYTEVLDVHHIIEVFLGGDDREDNLITACTVCHKLVHLFARGELYIPDLSTLSTEEANKFKRIVKLGTIIRKGLIAKKINKKQLKKMDMADTIGRTKPGTPQVAG